MENNRLMEIIDMAIQREEEAHQFYLSLCSKVQDATAKDTLRWIADEEQKHKEFLLRYRAGGLKPKGLQIKEVALYKIAEHQQEPETNANLDSKEAFLIAAHRELKSYGFYSDLAQAHTEGEIRTVLLKMANEELKHKEKMEYLYANTAFPQTAGG